MISSAGIIVPTTIWLNFFIHRNLNAFRCGTLTMRGGGGYGISKIRRQVVSFSYFWEQLYHFKNYDYKVYFVCYKKLVINAVLHHHPHFQKLHLLSVYLKKYHMVSWEHSKLQEIIKRRKNNKTCLNFIIDYILIYH